MNRKITRLLIIGILLVTLPVIILQAVIGYNHGLKVMKTFQQQYEQSIDYLFSDLILNQDQKNVERVLYYNMSSESFSSIHLYNDSNLNVWLKRDSEGRIVEVTQYDANIPGEKHKVEIYDFNAESKNKVADMEIWYSYDGLFENLFWNFISRLSQTLLAAFLILLVTGRIIRTRLIVPLKVIAEMIQDPEMFRKEKLDGAFREIIEISEGIEENIEKIKEKENNYLTLVNNVPGIVYRWFLGDQQEEGNHISKNIYNLVGHNTVSSMETWKLIIFPEDLFNYEDAIKTAVQNKERYEIDYRVIKDDGSLKWVKDNGKPISHLNGKIALDGVIIDITHIKELNEQLERVVNERTAELQTTNNVLKYTIESLEETQRQVIESEKMASLGHLISGVSNELNTPVGNCITVNSFLLGEIKKAREQFEASTLTKSDFNDLFDSAEEASHLINKNLEATAEIVNTFKKLSIKKDDIKKQTFNLYNKVNQIIEQVSFNYPLVKLDYQVTCDTALEIRTYEKIFEEVLFELVENSMLHGFEGLKKGFISVDLLIDGHYLYIKYTDDGCGVDPSIKNILLEPFISTKKSEGRFGLGLHILYNNITQVLGGRLQVDSGNKGFSLTYIIPVED